MRTLWIPLCLSLLSRSVLASEGSEDDQDYKDQCLPQLADRCFKPVMPSVACQLLEESADSCTDIKDICSVLTGSLQCASEIIDKDCKEEEGIVNFDSWLQGLTAVKDKICGGSDDLFRVFLKNPCFSSTDFLECLEDMTRIDHVVDLLYVVLNKTECDRILIALPTCNVRAHPVHSACFIPQEIINDLIFTFFSHSPCEQLCALSGGTLFPNTTALLITLLQLLNSVLL